MGLRPNNPDEERATQWDMRLSPRSFGAQPDAAITACPNWAFFNRAVGYARHSLPLLESRGSA